LASNGGARAVDAVQGRTEARIPERVLGTLVAVVLVDRIWLFFDYQLWQRQNSQLMLATFRSFAGPVTLDAMRDAFAQQAVNPFSATFPRSGYQ
jgi:hypothetical protein